MRRARKYLAWLEEYGLTRIHRAQRIILRRIFEVGLHHCSVRYIFSMEYLCSEIVEQTGCAVRDKALFCRLVLDGLMIETGCETYLGSTGLMKVEFSK